MIGAAGGRRRWHPGRVALDAMFPRNPADVLAGVAGLLGDTGQAHPPADLGSQQRCQLLSPALKVLGGPDVGASGGDELLGWFGGSHDLSVADECVANHSGHHRWQHELRARVAT